MIPNDLNVIVSQLDPKLFTFIIVKVPPNSPHDYFRAAYDVLDVLRDKRLDGMIAVLPDDIEVELGQTELEQV